jgi:hypothetical protein
MPVAVGQIALWPIHRDLEGRIREAIERAAADYQGNEMWRVSVYEGPELEHGTRLSVRGPQHRPGLWNDWQEEPPNGREHVYATVFEPLGPRGEGSWVEDILEERLRRFLGGPR